MALVLLTGLNLINYIDRYVLPGVQTMVQAEFHVNDAAIGLLTTAFFFTYMIVAPLTGWLGDRFPRKPLIVVGALLWSAATLLTAVVHSYQALLIRHAVVGIGEATFCIFAPAMLADFYPEAERNRILSIFYITIPVGAALGYLTGGELGSRFGWRNPFFISALPGVVIAVLFWFLVREPERGAADRLTATARRTTFAGLLRNPSYWVATLGMATMVFAMGGISVWLPTFFERFGGYSLANANRVIGGITVVDGILGTWIGGWIAQRWLRTNHRALYLVSGWSAMLVIPFGLLAFFGPRAWMLPAALAAEFFLFLNTGPLNAAIVNSVAAPIRSTAIAINLFMIHALGDAPSPHIIGWVSDRSSLRLGLGCTLVSLAVSSALLLVGSRYAPRLEEHENTEAVAG
jgi:predicted MFS family arabinose efflux permease